MNELGRHSAGEQRKGIRRTALIMTGIALAFYFGFILMGVVNA